MKKYQRKNQMILKKLLINILDDVGGYETKMSNDEKNQDLCDKSVYQKTVN